MHYAVRPGCDVTATSSMLPVPVDFCSVARWSVSMVASLQLNKYAKAKEINGVC